MLHCLIALTQVASPLSYDITILDRAPEPAELHITLTMTGDQDGETMLVLPNEWGGEGRLWEGIEALQVEGGILDAIVSESMHHRWVTHAPRAPLTIRWQVVQDRDGDPLAAEGNYYRPWIRPDYVHVLGHTVLIQVADEPSRPTAVSISVPNDWALATDVEGEHDSLAGASTSVIAAGDFNVETLDVNGAPLTIATRGGFDGEFAARAGVKALQANYAYWGVPGEPYLITGLPLEAEPGRSSFGGTNLGDAFALFGTENTPEDIVQRILVHEHAHTWVPSRVGGLVSGPEEPAGYWFSEGFTDWVTTRGGLIAGVWDAQGAIDHWNEFLAIYMSSPQREAPNQAITEGFWQDYDLDQLPYKRGKIFAGLVDFQIRAQTDGTHDLDDVLFAMRDGLIEGPAPLVFVDTVREVTGVDIADLHHRHIIDGELIILPEDTFGACGRVAFGERPAFEYGLELEQNPDGEGFIIEAVDPEGPAAGIFEPGMILLERVAGAFGDSTVDSAFRIRDSAGERVLTYRPAGQDTELYQQILPPDGELDSHGCAELLAGRALDPADQ